MKKSLAYMLIPAILIGLCASTATATVVDGVKFESKMYTPDVSLRLKGAGTLRYMIFIKAYAGALYLPVGVTADQALADVPKHLEVEYFHAISGEDFGPATNKSIAKNVDAATFEKLRDRIEYHNSLYEDVKPGDRYSLTYVPGKGTLLALNGIPKGTIDGADFAAALFSIWLGPNPIDGNFKQALLGQ